MSICPPVHPLSTKSVHLCPPHPLFRGVDMDTDMDKPADEWAGSGDTTSVSRTLDLTPILGEIARRWRRIHPANLTAQEALDLLAVLIDITDRLDVRG